jgi:hypothetical protein
MFRRTRHRAFQIPLLEDAKPDDPRDPDESSQDIRQARGELDALPLHGRLRLICALAIRRRVCHTPSAFTCNECSAAFHLM